MDNQLKVKRLTETAAIPTRGSEQAAGLDLYADASFVVKAGTHAIIPTGIAVAIPDGCCGQVWPRSGVSVRYGVDVLAGVIDSDYTGEIKVVLQAGAHDFEINQGDRIAQLLIVPVSMLQCVEVDRLDETARGACGFGSTGR